MSEELSKSAVKRQLEQIKKLGTSLSKLASGQIKQLPLSEDVAIAVEELMRLTSNVAKKRQTQYLAKVLSKQDNLSDIQAAYEKIQGQKHVPDAQFHLAEHWREKLVADPKVHITEFMRDFPGAESQTLRHLVQKARREQKQESNHGAYKALFRYIKQFVANDE